MDRLSDLYFLKFNLNITYTSSNNAIKKNSVLNRNQFVIERCWKGTRNIQQYNVLQIIVKFSHKIITDLLSRCWTFFYPWKWIQGYLYILRRSIWVIIRSALHIILQLWQCIWQIVKNILYLIFNSKTKVNHLNLKQMAIFFLLLVIKWVSTIIYVLRHKGSQSHLWNLIPKYLLAHIPFVLTGQRHTKQVNSCCKIILRYLNL